MLRRWIYVHRFPSLPRYWIDNRWMRCPVSDFYILFCTLLSFHSSKLYQQSNVWFYCFTLRINKISMFSEFACIEFVFNLLTSIGVSSFISSCCIQDLAPSCFQTFWRVFWQIWFGLLLHAVLLSFKHQFENFLIDLAEF